MNNYHFSQKSKRRLSEVDAELQVVLTEALKVSPIDFGIPSYGGLRTENEQAELFRRVPSVTRCDGVTSKSPHQGGAAIDVYAYVDGKASWDKVHLAIVAGVILATANRMRKKGKITKHILWGGTFGSSTFRGWDFPHFEKSKT